MPETEHTETVAVGANPPEPSTLDLITNVLEKLDARVAKIEAYLVRMGVNQ